MSQPLQIYSTPSSMIMKKNISAVQEHPDQEAQAPHLQSLCNNLQDGLQDNKYFQHCCHIFYFLKYPGEVGNQPFQEGTKEEKSLLQKGPKFAVTPATIFIKEYISTTTVAALQAGELNGVDCSGLYHDVNRIINTYANTTIHTNITKAEHLALEILMKDKDNIIVTDDKCVALVVMDKTECITKCKALLQDNSVYHHISKDTSPTIHKELISILQDYKNNNFISEIEYTLLKTSWLQLPSSKILWSS